MINHYASVLFDTSNFMGHFPDINCPCVAPIPVAVDSTLLCAFAGMTVDSTLSLLECLLTPLCLCLNACGLHSVFA